MKTELASDRHKTLTYPLRLPAALKIQLAEAASKTHRSMNGEILSRLEQSLAQSSVQYAQGAAA